MMWDELQKWEDRNNAIAFLVVDTQSLREDLRYYNAFNKECDSGEYGYICDIDTVSERLVYQSIKHAYDNIKIDYGLTYESIADVCYEYIVAELNKRGYDKGQLWNSETKTFESVKDFLARYKEKKNAS
tara:strand:+ start:511 stop:897 length:387 start_codon:yes stop_codon:yes gene_type:complete